MPRFIKHYKGVPYAQLLQHEIPEALDEAVQDLAEELGSDRDFGTCALCPRAIAEYHLWVDDCCPHDGRICDDNPDGAPSYAIHEDYLNILLLRGVVPADIIIATKE